MDVIWNVLSFAVWPDCALGARHVGQAAVHLSECCLQWLAALITNLQVQGTARLAMHASMTCPPSRYDPLTDLR